MSKFKMSKKILNMTLLGLFLSLSTNNIIPSVNASQLISYENYSAQTLDDVSDIVENAKDLANEDFTDKSEKAMPKKAVCNFDQNLNNINIDTTVGVINVIPTKKNQIEASLEGVDPDINSGVSTTRKNNVLNIGIENKDLGADFGTDGILNVYIPQNYSKELNVKTNSGEINLGKFNLSKLSVKNNTGKINLKGLTSKQLYVDNFSGLVNITGFKGKTNIKNNDGSIYINYAALTDNTSINVFSGKITLVLPSNPDFELRSNVKSGLIKCAFKLKAKKEKNKAVKWIVGTGKYILDLSTNDGLIEIQKKK